MERCAGRFVEHLLVDVHAWDAWTLGTGAATVLFAALLAAVPARRAARIDPVVALRADG